MGRATRVVHETQGGGAYKTPQAAYKTPQAPREGNEEKGKSWQRRAAGGEKEEEKPQETRVTGIYLYGLGNGRQRERQKCH